MKKTVLISLIITLLLTSLSTFAKDTKSISTQHHAGLRLGAWIHGGDDAPEIYFDPTDSLNILETALKDGNFFFELYFDYRILPASYLELSFGMVNQGTVKVVQHNLNDIGNLMLYPILVQFKMYPLASLGLKIQPYAGIGGGIYYGRRTVQFSNNYYSLAGYGQESETDFNYVVSGGLDLILNNKLSLELNGKYMPINFSDPLITINDYKALSITVGVKYRY